MPFQKEHKINNKRKQTKEHIKKRSNIGKHWKLSEETKNRIGKGHTGLKYKFHNRNRKPLSKETKNKISKSKLGSIPWNKGNGEYMKGEKHHLWKGGVSKPWYKEKIAGRKKQKKCEICNRIGNICFDHDHKTGIFRGWICHKCNTVLGMVDDNPKLLNKLIKYLSTLIKL